MLVPGSLRTAALLAALLLLWTACGRRSPSALEAKGGGGELRVVLPAEPTELDPNSSRDEIAHLLAPSLYSRLLMLDADSRLHPDLAESWEVSQGGLLYTFHLRHGVRWHDGHPFEAADVRWTLEQLAKHPAFAAEAVRRIDWVETPDEHTVIVHLREPWAPFLSTLAGFGTFILPRPSEGARWPAGAPPVGTGPFRFAEWVPGRRIVLAANRSFFRPGPFLDRVVYTFEPDPNRGPGLLTTGQADYLVQRPSLALLPRLARDPRLRVLTSPSDGRYYLAFNLRRRPFDDPRVREAFNRALDRPALLEHALYGYGAPGFGFYTPAVAWAYDPAARAPGLDRARARALLDAAGFRPDAEGVRLKLVLSCAPIAPYWEIAEVVAKQLRTVGISVHLEQITGRQWMERVLQRHDFELTLIGGNHGPDPENLNLRFGSRGTTQIMGYTNAQLDAALSEGARTVDLARRARAYFQAQEILAHDLPIAPLAEGVQITIYRRGVTGLPRAEARGLVPEYDFSLVRARGGAQNRGGGR
ncbi:MAG TPA: ABC transporter substrate-binding protein [Thermoanaerobaculia bacterium]|jgi:peptide/nickel transport system substrate-binding protein|nr:ABC transporter substrate-binding protein [Thermoanaerobaculia bacterium]